MTPSEHVPVALVTGASRGLGLALTTELVRRGWHVVVDARDGARLNAAMAQLPGSSRVTAVPGDIADDRHRDALSAAVERRGGLDLLVANASIIGPSPLPPLGQLAPADLLEVFEVNTLAPLALLALVLPSLRRRGGRVLHLSSDAAIEPYPGWGAYGAAKAALDHATAVLAVEEPELRCYAVDPGDMDTELHRLADPDADPAALQQPADVIPALWRLISGDLPSGRYVAAELSAAGAKR